jgi:hypothetical protein
MMSVAQTATVTTPKVEAYDNGYMIVSVTPGGEYAVYSNRSEEATDGGRIVNLATGAVTTITSTQSTSDYGSPSAITSDGKYVFGSFNSRPAYWQASNQRWYYMEMEALNNQGAVYGITPDGKYAVGEECPSDNIYQAEPRLWDEDGMQIELKNVPNTNLEGSSENNQVRFCSISSDGRYILGVVGVSYPNTINWFVYDRETETSKFIGYKHSTFNEQDIYIPVIDNLHHVDYLVASPNGRYVTGVATLAEDEDTGDLGGDYTFLYDVENDTFTVYNDSDLDAGYKGCAVDDNGIVYAGDTSNEPLRNLYVRSGKYWYSFSSIFSQHYGIDILTKTGLDNTGTPMTVTSDGRYIGTMVNPSDGSGINYTLYEDINDACASVDLMSIYTFSPTAGATFSQVENVDITFDRNIQLLKKASVVKLKNSAGKTVESAIGITVSGSKATMQFWPTTLTEGETYTIVIPEGTFAMAKDADMANKEITVSYVGRSAGAVQPLKVYPEDESQVSKFDYSSSHINIAFDTYLKLKDSSVKASVYRNDEAEPYESFMLYVSGNTLVVYPTTTVYFFKDNNYRVVIPAGAVTDLGGSGDNEEITLSYEGGYEREVSADDKYLFSDDFSSGLTNFMLYEGDGLTPSSEMTEGDYNFTATTTPWQYAQDSSTSSNLYAMSHSSYETPGTSDDWMVTPAIYLPDETCYLQFKSQGFRKNKEDHLKVYVIPSEKVYSTLGEDAMADLKANKVLVYDKVQDPGENEETTEGEWTDNFVSLKEYAGQQVYIAFVNENTDQSIVFVDDVEVIHDMRYLITLDNETSVVAQDDIEIYGRLTVEAEGITYTAAHLELIDSEGNTIDTIDEDNLTIDSKNKYSFRFAKHLPLEKGKENSFTLKIKLGDDQYTVSRTISNVAFQTTRRVVLEEYAGATCQNCPLGMLAIDKLKEELPNNFIPISIRRYGNDQLSYGLDGYVSFLNFSGAPSAVIDRTYFDASPMFQYSASKYLFNVPEDEEDEDPVWCDIVYSELETPAIADIDVTAAINGETNKVDSEVKIRYALDKSNVNASVFFVVLEDGLTSSQINKFYNVQDENLGEWGKNGIYGYYNNVEVPADDIARAVIGDSYNGTQGFVGSTVTASEEYTTSMTFSIPSRVSNFENARLVAILIDNNTDRVINANQCKFDNAGAANVVGDVTVANGNAQISVDGNSVVVNTEAASTVSVYNLAGSVIAQANGQGKVVANTNGYSGVAIVRVVTATGTTVQKVIIK